MPACTGFPKNIRLSDKTLEPLGKTKLPIPTYSLSLELFKDDIIICEVSSKFPQIFIFVLVFTEHLAPNKILHEKTAFTEAYLDK